MPSRDISKLIEPFQTSIRELIKRAKEEGLPAFVTDTTRTMEEQRELVRKGYSKTLYSKHLTGEAADIAFQIDGKLSYDPALYEKLYEIGKKIPYIIWPYKDLNWKWDYPHWQYDKDKKMVYNNEMEEREYQEKIRKLEENERKLNTEIGRVTRERDERIPKQEHDEIVRKLNTEIGRVTRERDTLLELIAKVRKVVSQ